MNAFRALALAFFLLLAQRIFPETVRYYNGRILRNHEVKSGELWVAKGKIIAPQKKADRELDVQGKILAPGFIDLQINGGFGIDFSVEAEKVGEVAGQLPQYGVTSFLPTIVSSSREKYQRLLPHLQPKKGGSHGASILGLHLEGPFFHPKCCGAHEEKLLCSLDGKESIESFYGNLEGVKIVTLAPELCGAANAIRSLREKNIIVSVGHSQASYNDMEQAIELGVRFVTHLFNVMTPFHHREPGIVGAVLTNDQIFYSLIVDGHHVHPASIRLAWRSNPEGLILVTDAIRALGLPSGDYRLGEVEIFVEGGKSMVKGTKTLAGSVLSMDEAVRHLRSYTGCSIVQALESASYKPAKLLGMERTKGTLGEGADADFIVLDDQLRIHASFVLGELAWSRSDYVSLFRLNGPDPK